MDLKELEIKGMKLTAFNKKGIYTVEDLVNYLPRKYYDFTKPKRSIRDLKDGEYDSIVGTVIDYTSKNKGSLINVKLKDENNRSFGVTFFNQPFIMKGLNKGGLYIVCGVIKILKDYNGYVTITNPIVFSNEISKYSKIYPVYSKIEKTSDSFLQSKINSSIAIVNKEDYIEPILLNKYNLIPLYKAIRLIHQPKTMNDVQLAKKRILFDDLFQFNFKVKEHSIDEESYVKIKSFKKAKELMDSLPFELTEGQRLALRNLSNKMKQNKKINALVQGDVGCGAIRFV